MTDEASSAAPRAALHEAAAPGLPSVAASSSPSSARLIGLDLARGLAVFGMYSAHVGPDVTVGGPVGFLLETARGRSAALFAVLAGFSLVIITGRPRPRRGRAGRQAAARIALRAVALIALGYALTSLDTDVDVILSYYGLLFLLVLPLYRLRAATLALIATAGALFLPQLLYLIRMLLDDGAWSGIVVAADPLARITGSDGIVELLFTGDYPALTWAPFLIAGMAVARLDLTRPGIRSRLALIAAGLAVTGYGLSWLALRLIPHALSAVAAATDGGSASSAWWSDTVGEPENGMAGAPLAWLLVAAPHSQTTLSVVGNTGVALLVLTGCLAAADRLPRLARAAAPVAAVGTMALTVYVLHIIALWFLNDVWYVAAVEDETMAALPVLLAFIAGALLLAVLWTRRFRRGPLEHLLHTATLPARHIR
ncbi:DUF418 domain-containing protein [Streptomyces sp. SID8379]|uniref:DUF418 domain-containing protein n=1 Tax=unclassified Streptomyces TaxID=2593676 RepID=UPI0003A9800B|nr:MULTISPECIES: DUF418 domain-containing protein [unclassified Streptomyces]MYW64436.1 DUF418 domain-containing protein [Streptomyces sp. SID8379]